MKDKKNQSRSQNPKHLDEAFEKILQEMLQTFIRKNKDYGKDNILDTRELGILFRVKDKVNRLNHLINNGHDPEFESIEETWLDIAVYAVIAIILRRGWFEKLKLSSEAKKE